ncbi:hypothetical protein ATSB10_04260 [Dyella thiooxydans]|uniref:Uncharacterized protein n=1 Tax=Dyella thiooxydans TaxID=445710 RepID=A0A160MXJ2_9GAMM|nr:hypothetical protein [Dyella thiooxydans]AND67880.1 hypothetical protein ATSB10_04260 [Dyella thiooxydans]
MSRASAVRSRDHVPPLLRGLGFLLILVASAVAGTMEHRSALDARARLARLRAHADAVAQTAAENGPDESVALELRLLRLQLREHDFSDRVLENRAFQVLGSIGSLLVALSFLVEAQAKWPRRPRAQE